MKLYDTLEKQLKKENNFVTDNDELKKWVVIHKAQNFDAELIELLLENEELKEKFFVEVKGTLVFKQNLFIQFLEQKNYLNDSYTQYKNKVGLTIDGKYLKQRNEVALVWPFKDCILEGGQSKEEDKREEIFFNEILAQDEITQLLDPKVLTGAKTYDQDGEHDFSQFTRDAELNQKRGLPEDTITDNLIIKGNNLLALHTLKKEFAGKVKLIYIDPPYNTGNDSFKYNDNFNHSSWLIFMKNRLEIAKTLLRDDGVMFVQCDDNEQAYLKVLMDEVFGRENLINTICIKMSHLSGVKMSHNDKRLPKIKEYIHAFSKKQNIKINPIFIDEDWENVLDRYNSFLIVDKSNPEDYSKWEVKSLKETFIDNKISTDKEKSAFVLANATFIFRTARNKSKQIKDLPNDDNFRKITTPTGLEKYIYKKEEVLFASGKLVNGSFAEPIGDIWNDIGINNLHNEGNVEFQLGKKPEKLIQRIIKMITNENDIVLDFHLGSGTTAAVAHKMGRQYIGIEQMDYIETVAVERLKKVIAGEQDGISKSVNWQGGGSFTYLELKKYNQTFIEQIEKSKDSKTLLKIWEQMKAKSSLNYNVDIQKQDAHIDEFKQLALAEQKEHLTELLDKNQLYVNLSSINDTDFECSEKEKQVTKDFYQLKKD